MNRDLLDLIHQIAPYAEALVELSNNADKLASAQTQLDSVQREFETVSAKTRAAKAECEAKKAAIREAEAKLGDINRSAAKAVEDAKASADAIIADAKTQAQAESGNIHVARTAELNRVSNKIRSSQIALNNLEAVIADRSADHDSILASLASLKKGIPG